MSDGINRGVFLFDAFEDQLDFDQVLARFMVKFKTNRYDALRLTSEVAAEFSDGAPDATPFDRDCNKYTAWAAGQLLLPYSEVS